MNTLDTRKVIAFFDAELDAEYEKAVQWYQEQLNATNWTDFEISLFELMEICCHELESHIRKAEPRIVDGVSSRAWWSAQKEVPLP